MLHPQGRAFKGGGGNPAAFPQKKRCNLKKRTPPIFTGNSRREPPLQRLRRRGFPPAWQTASCRRRTREDISAEAF